MRKKIITAALAGTLGLTGVALMAPSSALAQPADGSSRLSALKDALKGLVTDGTLTQSQADEVASTLAEARPEHGPRGHDGGPGRDGAGKVAQEEVAKVLGITVDELRTQREAGKTLAQIAEAEGVEKADLVDGLVAAAKAQLAQAVTDGRLTQARADELSAGLEARITEQVDRVGRGPRGGHGRHHGPHGDAPDGTSSTAPSTAPSIESSSA
ncbi:MAG: hypothetical protein JWN08_441 [Frankiales bacterium]|nr:hypothetical protein [Frankiales bacterium]